MDEKRLSLKLKLITWTLLMFCAFVDSQIPCMTIQKETGVCIPVRQCKTVRDKIAANKVSASLQNYIEMSKCGDEKKNETYMCCDTFQADIYSQNTNDDFTDDIGHGMSILWRTKCGQTGSPRVARGTDANLCEYRWMAQLVYNTSGTSAIDCAGSLITAQYVLTAAHCIKGYEDKLVSVVVGSLRRTHGKRPECIRERGLKKCAPELQRIEIEATFYHYDFKDDVRNDIGLIRLAKKAIYNDCVQPICMPITQTSQIMPEKLKVAGWGLTESRFKANILQVAEIPVKNVEYCSKKHVLKFDETLHFCVADYFSVQACKGDSGGPIFNIVKYKRGARYVQYGIVSYGSTDCGTKYPGIDIQVIPYIDWITSILRD